MWKPQFVSEKNDRELVVACMGLAFKPNILMICVNAPVIYCSYCILIAESRRGADCEPNVASYTCGFHLTGSLSDIVVCGYFHRKRSKVEEVWLAS